MQGLTVASLLLAATLAAPAFAQEGDAQPAPAPRKAAPPKPLYNWFEASYAINYLGDGDSRIRSDAGYRVAASGKLMDHLHAFVSYDSQDYNPAENEFLSIGLGAFWPLGRSTDIGVNASYEDTDLDGLQADGYGLGASLRTMLSRRTELALSYRRTEQSIDVAGPGADLTTDTIALFLAAPLARSLDLTFRAESVDLFFEGGGTSFDPEGDNYLVGLRFTF